MVAGLVLALAGGALGAVTVRPGETLSDIAARNGTSVAALARANGIADPDRVIAGTRLRLTGGGGAPASAPAPAGGGVVVGAGETLSAIAARHGTTVAALAAANGIADPDRVVAGTRLVVPGAATASAAAPSGGYTVRPGETLSAIAARNGTSVAALARANGIADPDRVVAGTRLTIGGGGVAAAAAPGRAPTSGVPDLIAAHAAAHGVDPALARAVAWQESGWSQSARSGAGAIGVMQLMPDTAAWFGPSVLGRRIDPYSLEQNVEAGVAYLGWLQRQSGSRDTALAAYYQGLTSVRRRGTLPETDRYVANVLAQVGRR